MGISNLFRCLLGSYFKCISETYPQKTTSYGALLVPDVMTVCYDNFMITSDECVRLQCEFDLAVDAFSGDIEDIVFK